MDTKLAIKNIYDSISSKVNDFKTAYDKQGKCVSDELKKELKDRFLKKSIKIT